MKITKHQQWRKGFPYYKAQCWDIRVNAWHDIQKSFGTEVQARVYGSKVSSKYRVMKITREGRSIV